MKSWIEKVFYGPRYEFLFLFIPFIVWVFCFWNFFTGRLPLFEDAISYADHIRFYTDCLSKGVFPLWDPTWFYGAPNDFFLRRIGDVNPLFLLLVVFKWIGVPWQAAYLVFIGIYYFLAGWAVYLIARSLLEDRFYGFVAYILFLFSSWGSEVFYNYIVIVFVPIIWFFYFLLCFARRPWQGYFLGMCLCLGLIVTTYIPFFFVIIFCVFALLFVLFYGRVFVDFLKKSTVFFLKNKFFTLFCAVFLVSASVPGYLFYKESKSGAFVLPGRHLGADSSSAVAVGLQNMESGDLVSHGYFDRIFSDQKQLNMGDIYVPYVFFLVLLTSLAAKANRLIFFLLFNILAISLATITTASRLHLFYEHIVFFKFIRQVYYLFWLSLLPMAILLSVVAFKSLLTAIKTSSRKTAWLGFIIACHLIFAVFLLTRQEVLTGAWMAVILSLAFFIVYFRFENKISHPAGFFLLLSAVFIQSAQVYAYMDGKLFEDRKHTLEFSKTHDSQPLQKMDLYYATRWFSALVNYMDPAVLDSYLSHRFIFYDNVLPYAESPEFFKILETTASSNGNIAYVPKVESAPGDWQSNPAASGQADNDPLLSGELVLAGSDANTWKLKSHLSHRKFLVINDNYDGHWHAFVNGRPAKVLRANVAFKGLWLEAGQSDILLGYSTPQHYIFRFALGLLFAGTFLYLIVLLRNDTKIQPYV